MVRKVPKTSKNTASHQAKKQPISNVELEKRVVESAKQVVKEYPGIFERLAKYDRV